MRLSDLVAYARRRIEEDPGLNPLDDPADFFAVLAVLSSFIIEARLDETETDRQLAAGATDKRAAVAARFRQARGLGGPHG